MEERGGLTGCGEGVEGLWAGEGEVRGSPGEREGPEGVSGAGRGAMEGGEEGLGAGVGLAAAGLVAAGVGLLVAEATIALPGLGAVGGPRGFGETGGGTLFGSGLCAGSASSGPGMGTLRVGVGGSACVFLMVTVDGLGETGGFRDFLASIHSQLSSGLVLSETSDTGLRLRTTPPFCCGSPSAFRPPSVCLLGESDWLLL